MKTKTLYKLFMYVALITLAIIKPLKSLRLLNSNRERTYAAGSAVANKMSKATAVTRMEVKKYSPIFASVQASIKF